jgi:conjugal transfer pilus assembly protein TraW
MRTCYLKNGSQTVQRCVLAISLLGLSFTAKASSLGAIGETFPVAERSFLSLIESRLKGLADSGELDAVKEQWINQVNEHAHRPTPCGLPRATVARTHHYNPSVTLGQDIKDHEGRVLMRAGTHVNALDNLYGYQPHWIFFNADDKAQIAWAKNLLNQDKKAKVILTGGDIGDAERTLNVEIFFDQASRITQQLNIQHVPAEVTRSGQSLLIQERLIGEDGHAL